MNYSHPTSQMKVTTAKFAGFIAIALIAITVAVAPVKTYAFDPIQIIDPFCLWSGCGDDSQPTTVNNTNSNNTNSNVNSPGGTVNAGNTANVTGGTPVYIPVVTTPVYSYNYGNNSNSALNANCYATPTSVGTGETVYWRVSAYGGNGSYYYSWTGTDGLSGNGSSITTSYNNGGSKNATVTVVSGGQTISRNCDTSVIVTDYNYNNNNNYYNYNYNNYNNGYNNNYSSLSVTCRADSSFAPVGNYVRWTSNVTGGNGNYSYRWTGTDGVSSSGSIMNVTYGNTGTKYATLTVYSGSQSITRDCNGGVTIGSQNYNGNYNGNGNGGFEIACFADADRVRTGVPVTWAVEAVGGNGDYSYSWSGSEGLSGSQRSAVTKYEATGSKNATVTVTSGGQSSSKLCGNVVTVVSGATTGGNGNTTVKTTDNTDSTGLSAASLFSLKNVPWGWVAILVILVLFAMVMYLLFTRRETVIHETIK